MSKGTKVLTLALIVLFIAFFIHPMIRESFYNVIPTNIIDPEYVDLTNETALFVPASSSSSSSLESVLYHLSGQDDQTNLNCGGVTSCDIVSWIANDKPLGDRLLNELVLRFDPSADPLNPNHAPRILRLLMMNLPSYACRTTANRYLPIIQKCYPKLVEVA